MSVKGAVLWFDRRSPGTRIVMTAVSLVVPFYGAAVIEAQVHKILTEGGGWVPSLAHALAVGLSLTIVISVWLWLHSVAEDVHREQREISAQKDATNRQREQVRAYAATLMDQFVADRVRRTREALPQLRTPTEHESAVSQLVSGPAELETIVQKMYQLFESQYGQAENIDDRVDFEVTFMTKSYRDQQITIAAYANREGRAPPSMAERATNPNRYDGTVTEQLYGDQAPKPRIIPDTSVPEVGYKELYPGQKQRIQSTVVFPVLSDQNIMLGALVVHCNRKRFFNTNEDQFWVALFETFAKRLALEKLRLDALLENHEQASPALHISVPPF